MFAAAAAMLLYISSFLPTASIAVAAAAGLFCAAAVIECGLQYGFMCWAAASAVGFLIAADKTTALMFLLCLGLYPVLKGVIEKSAGKKLGWALKLCYFNLVCGAVFAAYKLAFVAVPISEKLPIPLLWLAANAVFIVYDIGLTKLISYYITVISPRLRNKKER